MAKENAALRGALERLIHSGAYAELLQRWGLSTGAVSAFTINEGS